ncbi:MAG: Dabb family protein [Gammaproteobacteria bacterium]|nr:Dabb family protein [Gammaproteobacteria bacterium]
MASELTHLVFLWLKTPNDADAITAIRTASRSFARIPSVQQVSISRAEPSERAIVDDSFDLAISLTFQHRAALDDYLKHPLHTSTVHDVIRPLIRKIVVYDLANVASE